MKQLWNNKNANPIKKIKEFDWGEVQREWQGTIDVRECGINDNKHQIVMAYIKQTANTQDKECKVLTSFRHIASVHRSKRV